MTRLWLTGAVAVFFLAGCTNEPAVVATPTSKPVVVTPAAKSMVGYRDNVYTVGIMLPPGTYATTGEGAKTPGMCPYTIYDAKGNLVAAEFFTAPATITVAEGQTVALDGGCWWQAT